MSIPLRWFAWLGSLGLSLAPLTVGASVSSASPEGVSSSAVTVTPHRSTVTAPQEYFASRWHDPMDFSDAEDFDATPGHMVQGWSSLLDGRLNVAGAQQVFLLRSDPGSYPTSATRDPRSRPLDANRFRRITLRMHSDRDSNAAMFFRQCNSCADGLKYFRIRAGWHSYDLDMTGPWDLDGLPSSSLPAVRGAPWAGSIEMLWMITSFDSSRPNLSLEDVGIVESTPGLPLSISAGAGNVDLWMDFDRNPNNDGWSGGAGESASHLGVVNGQGTVVVPDGVLGRGRAASFYTVRNGVRSASSIEVAMPRTSSPSPRVLTPWEGGGEDWSGVVRGDPWDMEQPTDALTANAGSVFAWGRLNAWTTGPVRNDPAVFMNLSGRPIDAQLYQKLAITITYDGPWGLADAPGGGMVGRIMWKPSGLAPVQVSDDLVLRTGRATYYVDLRPWPPTAVLDPAGNSRFIGWGVGAATWVSGLQFHPHEDRGDRSWQIEEVRLLRNDFVDNNRGGFDVRFIDDVWAPGTFADIYADPDRDASNPGLVQLAGGVPVGPGINTFRWTGWPAAPGSYHIVVRLHRAGQTGDSYSSGRVDYGPAPAPWPPPVK
ncbi:MAG: hypothetical protein FJW94_01845 [Actinobacteria bacterium]|nr:hypothetical protein [Actinomycetota bacterium]